MSAYYYVSAIEELLAQRMAERAAQQGGGGATPPPAAAASPAAPEGSRSFERAPTPIHTPEGFAAAWEGMRGELPAHHPMHDFKPQVAPWHPADPLNPANQATDPTPQPNANATAVPWWMSRA